MFSLLLSLFACAPAPTSYQFDLTEEDIHEIAEAADMDVTEVQIALSAPFACKNVGELCKVYGEALAMEVLAFQVESLDSGLRGQALVDATFLKYGAQNPDVTFSLSVPAEEEEADAEATKSKHSCVNAGSAYLKGAKWESRYGLFQIYHVSANAYSNSLCTTATRSSITVGIGLTSGYTVVNSNFSSAGNAKSLDVAIWTSTSQTYGINACMGASSCIFTW